MSNTWLIVKREYAERVKSKAFIFMTLLIPGVMIVAFGAMLLTAAHAGANEHIGIASNNQALAEEVRDDLASSKAAPITAEVVAPAGEAERAALQQQVDSKQLDGYVWVGSKPSGAPDVNYISRSTSDLFVKSRIEEAVSKAEMRTRLRAQGLPEAEVDRMLAPVSVDSTQIKDGKLVSSDSTKSFLTGYVMVFLLYFSVTYYAMNVARSVIQEKTSRIFEVMLATVKPEEMMAGKMLGVGAAGLTQIMLWISIAAIASFATVVTHSGMPAIHLGISLVQVLGFCIYFLLGFAFYSAVAAAAGACFNAESEVQQLSFVIVMPMFVAVMSYAYILSSPNSAYSVFLSMFPPTAPLAMFLRMTAQMPPLWEIATSIVLMLGAIYGTLWIAARIYRVGILMYGKRPNLPELLRWLRYA
jgi:ABC-2 type transport system permease protein